MEEGTVTAAAAAPCVNTNEHMKAASSLLQQKKSRASPSEATKGGGTSAASGAPGELVSAHRDLVWYYSNFGLLDSSTPDEMYRCVFQPSLRR